MLRQEHHHVVLIDEQYNLSCEHCTLCKHLIYTSKQTNVQINSHFLGMCETDTSQKPLKFHSNVFQGWTNVLKQHYSEVFRCCFISLEGQSSHFVIQTCESSMWLSKKTIHMEDPGVFLIASKISLWKSLKAALSLCAMMLAGQLKSWFSPSV